jgi:hypothetical protein
MRARYHELTSELKQALKSEGYDGRNPRDLDTEARKDVEQEAVQNILGGHEKFAPGLEPVSDDSKVRSLGEISYDGNLGYASD